MQQHARSFTRTRFNTLGSLVLSTLLSGTTLIALAQTPPSTPSAKPADKPLTALPYTPGLDVSAMDKTADPCVDFYQYTCGGWIKNNPIPADQAKWDVYRKLAEDNQRFLWGILESLSNNSSATTRNAAQQKSGDYFAACMDEAAVEKRAATPLQPYLALINGMQSKADLSKVLGSLQLVAADDGLFFGFGSNQDFGDSSRVIAFASSGGLSLPDRDYYTKDDEKSKTIRDQYLAHVTQMFVLLGDNLDTAKNLRSA